MRKGAAKAGLIFFEVAAILLAVIAAGAAFLYWRLEQGPVALGVLRPSAQFAVERRLPADYQCRIARIELARNQSRGAYALRLSGVRIRDGAGTEAARAEAVALSFAVGDLLKGEFGPKTIDAQGAAFRMVRNEAQTVEIPAARRRRDKRPFSLLAPVFDGGFLESAFERAEMADAQITFVDVASGRRWTSQNANIAVNRSPEGLNAVLHGDIDLEGASAAISADAAYAEKTGVITADIDGANFPVGDILSMFYGKGAAIIDAPVSGEAVISFTADGDVLASRFAARIDRGRLNIKARPAAIEFIEWETRFDPEKNEFTLDRFAFDVGGNSGVLAGAVALTFGEDVRDPERIAFNLAGQDLTLNFPGFLAGPLPLARATLDGAYSIPSRRIDLNAVDLRLLDVAATGRFAMAFPRAGEDGAKPSPGVDADISIDGALDPERLLKIWPLGAASGARDWVAERLAAARLGDIKIKTALAPGAVGSDGLIPDEAMTITFTASDATAYYVKEMTPLTHAEGAGVLRGNSFKLNVERGRVGDIAVSEGEVDFPVFIPKWRPTYIRFSATGGSEAMLGVLDQAPLRLLSKINLKPEQFRGDATARVEIMRPNKREVEPEEYRYNGTANFENMRISGLAGDVDLTGGKGAVKLEPRSVTITADARLSDSPLDIAWKQNFYREDGPSRITVKGTVDSTTGDLFGVPSRRFVHGPVMVEATATGDIGAFETLDLDADFSAAALSVDAVGWRKPPDEAATGRIEIAFSPQGASVEAIDIKGDSVALAGDLAFRSDGALQAANFKRFFLKDAVDLTVTAARNAADALSVTAVGEYFNAGPMIRRVVEGAGGDAEGEGVDWGPGVSVTARIHRTALRNGVEYRDATLDLWRDADRLQALNFSAIDARDAPLRVALAETGEDDGPRRTIEAQSSEIGELLSGVLGLTSISGGEGVMKVDLGAPGRKGFFGEIEARNLTVTKAPLLARVFSAGSLDGLTNLLNGEGIDLTYAYGQFDFSGGVLSVKDFRATGPSVGMTAAGAVAMGEGGEINLGGAVAPLYQLNSALGNAPIIGDILVGKKGEGLVALSYSVSGERGAPTVFVNPLSALTPGIFRNIMQPQRRAPDAAGEAAGAAGQDATTE